MLIIEELSDYIEDEIEDAGKYAKIANEYKETRPALAELYFKLSNEELGHMSQLHMQVTAAIEAYKKEHGAPPEHMMKLYEILHRKHMENAATVKGMLSLYKGA